MAAFQGTFTSMTTGRPCDGLASSTFQAMRRPGSAGIGEKLRVGSLHSSE